MTNLLAMVVITLVTNTSERFPTHLEPGGDFISQPFQARVTTLAVSDLVYRTHSVPDSNPTNKWVKTTVVRVTEVKFELNGKPMVAKSEETISEVEKEYALEKTEKWNFVRDMPPPTVYPGYQIHSPIILTPGITNTP